MCADVVAQPFDGIAIKAKNIKCFGDNPAGFHAIKLINIAIGRNNSGKSTLLDLIEAAVSPKSINHLRGHLGREPKITIEFAFTEDIKAQIPSGTSSISMGNGETRQLNLAAWSEKRFENVHRVICRLETTGSIQPCGLDGYSTTDKDEMPILDRVVHIVCTKLINPFRDCQFRRLGAERDILPETRKGDVGIGPSGAGFTNLIRKLLTVNNQERDLVEKVFLDALNSILRPDCEFTRILILENAIDGNNDSPWEIHLEEEKKGSIPISQTGSGLKTVMLVLGNLLLVPHFENIPIAKYIFAFEELENNLHPAAQRRLFRYLQQKALDHKYHFFITTHSNVVIDHFARDDMAQILHVTHNCIESKVERHSSTSHGWAILDDLDIRASDILQSNSVIWVEGPSDRIYLNRWIALWADGLLQEGVHYQCLFYGGNLNAHISFEDPEEVEDLVAALKINRRAIFVADSDRKASSDPLKPHTQRWLEEVDAIDGIGFITQGRTIENYIPTEVWQLLSGQATLQPPDVYANAVEYAHEKGLCGKDQKVKLAKKVVEKLNRQMLVNTLDLEIHLQEMCAKIYDWNRLPVLTSVTEMVSPAAELVVADE